jgi:hypothetical protein
MKCAQRKILTALGLAAAAALVTGWDLPHWQAARPAGESLTSDSPNDLEAFRQKGDLQSERRHVWAVFSQLTQAVGVGAPPRFESWYGEAAVFANVGAARSLGGIHGFARASQDQESSGNPSKSLSRSADAPILSYTLYNFAAYEHIRSHRLQLSSELNQLSKTGIPDNSIDGDRSVAPFPRDSIVIKTVWWPVARKGLTPLPVWDPASNQPRRGGNDYMSWTRVVVLDPLDNASTVRKTTIEFAGQSFQDAHRIGLQEFYRVRVDADMARRLMLDHSARKAASVVLGRSIEEGDYLVLVGLSLATKEIREWVWGTLWWHDQAEVGPFAADRPPSLSAEWRNYLLQVAFDTDKPAAFDGGPHICFNPWLEGRFPDAGHGGGTASNCRACHSRASYPPVDFLPVTRGIPDLTNDPAYAPGRLRTNFVWSIALHSRP